MIEQRAGREKLAADYRTMAAEAEAFAGRTKSPETSAVCLNIAKGWRKLADETENFNP